MSIPGAPPPNLQELVRAEDRISFIYLEHSVIHRDSNALTSTNMSGTVHIPAATLGALLLGPGTSISHQAISLIAESGVTVVWVGEEGVRYYAHGRSLAHTSRLLQAQARLSSNTQSRLSVARKMYAMRFPGEDVSKLTMQQLRGREGARVRKVYREHSVRTGVKWSTREYIPGKFELSDRTNAALSAANSALYGVVHAVVVSLGCTPGLGFVHTGHDRAFVYDIADLYKAELTIPIAFDIAASEFEDVGSAARRAVRDYIHNSRILKRCTYDIRQLLLPDGGAGDLSNSNTIALWDEKYDAVPGGHNYGEEFELMSEPELE